MKYYNSKQVPLQINQTRIISVFAAKVLNAPEDHHMLSSVLKVHWEAFETIAGAPLITGPFLRTPVACSAKC